MTKNIMRSLVCIVAVLGMVACGGSSGSGGGGSTATDSITIDSLTPSIVSAGTPTSFTISVSYSLQTKEGGVIAYGFKADSSNSYALDSDERIISKGTGTASFITTRTLTEATTLRVQLVEYPTPTFYSPLVTANRAITVN